MTDICIICRIIESVVKGCRGSIPPQLEELSNSGIAAES